MAWRTVILLIVLWPCIANAQDVHDIKAPQLDNQSVHVEVHLPPGYSTAQKYPVLYFNDGQDSKAIHLESRLRAHYLNPNATRRIVVAVHMLPDRMGIYGLSNEQAQTSEIAKTKYGDVGTKAHGYTIWFTQTLVPYIDAHYSTQATRDGRAVLGWSLGAVAAFSIGWQHPQQFGQVGMFSPSLWLNADSSTPQQAQVTRLVQARVENDAAMQRPAIYLAVGTREDTDDRDGDGVNDAVDDVFDMGNAMAVRQVPHKIVLLTGGRHNQPAWSEMLPRFLNWLDTASKSE